MGILDAAGEGACATNWLRPGLVRGGVTTQHFEVVRCAAVDRLPANGAVEGDEFAPLADGESEKVDVGQMPGASAGELKQAGLQNAYRIGPESIAFEAGEFGQDFPDAIRSEAGKRVAGFAEDSDAAVFGEGARGPSAGSIEVKPLMRGGVELVVAIDEGNEEVHVQQGGALSRPSGGPGFHSSSSRRRLTSSMVTTGPFGRLGRTGTPFRYSSWKVRGWRASRRSSDTTLPAVAFRCCAICLTVSSSSSSISMVVLIT